MVNGEWGEGKMTVRGQIEVGWEGESDCEGRGQ